MRQGRYNTSGARALLSLLAAVLFLAAPSTRAALRPPVRALHGDGACLALEPDKSCPTHGRGFTNPNGEREAAVSADGRSLYIASNNANAIGILRIDPRTGRLSQEAGAAGCLAKRETGPEFAGCAHPRGFGGQTTGVAVSPDNRFVYVSSEPNPGYPDRPEARAVAVFARDARGRLQQLTGSDGCVADRAFEGCAVVPTLDGYDIALDTEGLRAYVGGRFFTVLARDPASGVLSYIGCASADGTGGCGPASFGLSIKSPTWVGGVGYATAWGESRESRGLYVEPLLALRPGAAGLPDLLPAPGGCRVDVTYLRGCTVDGRLDGVLLGLVPVGDAELVGFSSGENEVPARAGTPFQLWSLRLDADGAMSAKGAHCLSTTRHRRCARAPELLGGSAITGNARRIYVAGERGVTAIARQPSGALRVLARVGRLRNPLLYNPTLAVITPNGRFIYVIAQSFADTGSVKAYATG